ncbi:nicotinamide riboside transporter PnuC [Kaistella sp.]|uniref:nicotinamide riboside transporter PnuC n=1 Tax=Kaistella sp. TaxID=2782235 RepID=UPI00359FB34B
MTFFDIKNIAFEIIGYPISYVELIGTLFGLLSVYFASRANILTWTTGIINELFLFILFFQVHLYADMFLQVFFFLVTLYGWYNWKQKPQQNSITSISSKTKIWLASVLIISTIIAGFFIKNIHLYLPNYFKIRAAFPFIDSFVMVLSIIATVLLAKKKIETWYLWILVDIVCVFLFFKKGIVFLALEYLVFLGLATYGLWNWKKQLNNG